MTSPAFSSADNEPVSAEMLIRWKEIPSTCWTLVDEAGRPTGAASTSGMVAGELSGSHSRGARTPGASRRALAELVHLYEPVLRGHLVATLRIRGDHADDLVQGFLTDRILEQNLVAHARAERGRFRRFLLTALNNYVADVRRRERAAKRSSPLPRRSLDAVAEVADPAPGVEDRFDRLWAAEVLNEVMRRTRRACIDQSRDVVWHILESRILLPAVTGLPPSSHAELASRYGLESPSQSANLLTTAKQTFIRIFRSVVAEYAVSSGDAGKCLDAVARERLIDEEVCELWKIFSAPGP